MIKRELYLQKLMALKDQPLIKVITGMRRCGKSTLLQLFARELQDQGVPEDHIFMVNLEALPYEELLDYKTLYNTIKQRLSGKQPAYVLLDEIQEVPSWEKVLNSLFEEGFADLYITGSNGKMLSSDLATLLSGRYVEIQVYPLSFKEYLNFLPNSQDEPVDTRFQHYLQYGGLPVIPGLPQKSDTIEMFLSGIYNTVLLKDVVQRSAVRDSQLLDALVHFLADTVGSPVSSHKISGYLTSKGRKATTATLDNYLQMLENAFIFYKAQRYDIKGKLYLKTQEKYYIVDTGLRNMLLGFRNTDYGHVLENVVYLELLRRGYRVSVGKIGPLEVDFVAENTDKKCYIQVCASALDETTKERELRPLRSIPDQYEKILITQDRTYIKDFEGIRNVNVVDFLLE